MPADPHAPALADLDPATRERLERTAQQAQASCDCESRHCAIRDSMYCMTADVVALLAAVDRQAPIVQAAAAWDRLQAIARDPKTEYAEYFANGQRIVEVEAALRAAVATYRAAGEGRG